MRKILSITTMLVFFFGNAQNSNVTYTISTAVFPNPERGFYKYSAAHSSGYDALEESTMKNYRLNNNITLVFRYFYLEDFKNSPISAAYLTKIQTDFDRLRSAGLKCIIRFAYSSDADEPQRDATKATMLAHIVQLKPLLIQNSDIISVMQVGFIGTYGEWYSTSQSDFGGWGYNGTNLTTANINHRKDIVNAILAALPANRMVQIRKPAFKQDLYSPSALTSAQAYNESNLARIGHHNDCFLASDGDYGTYDNPTVEYPYLAQDTKFLPMGGETCELNSPRTDCSSAVAEMGQLHWSFLNLDYYPGVIDGFEDGNCFTDIQKKLGYRFELKTGVFPQTASAGGTMPVTLTVRNVGFAAPFNERNAFIILKNTLTNQIFRTLLTSDPRLWLGPSNIIINENLQLPANMPAGSYKLYLHLPDASASLSARPEYAIRFANENMWESTTGYNNLNHTVTIGTLGIADHSKLNVSIYPVPANDQLTIEMEGIGDFKVTLYNALGQNVEAVTTSELNKITLETQQLSNGLYFVEFVKGTLRDTRKIIVRH